MKIEMKVFPAHYRIADDTVQTVEEHLQGVKAKCEEYAGKLQFGSTGKLLGVLHDIGKYPDEFYDYITEGIRREKAGERKLNTTVDHGKHGAMLVLERYHNGNALRKMMSEVIAMAICYHHGGMEDYISDDLEIKLFKRCEWPDRPGKTYSAHVQACERLFGRVMSPEQLDELFEKAVAELQDYIDSQKSAGTFSSYSFHLLIKFLYSCLIDADRYDTYLFMQNKEEEKATEIHSLWNKFSERLAIKEDSFRKQETGSELEERIKKLRYEIWLQCRDFGNKPAGIYTLTVATGGGKTLSSLRYALDHARIRGKSRILYVLPFTSIIEQNAGVVREALDADDYLLEHHSNVVNAAEYDKDKLEYRHLLTERWSSPIIFTTMVQFLNTLFSAGTQNIRRFHNLTDTILIFDEIQALPVKCISLFNETVNFLSSQCRDTIILCSATQPNLDKVRHKIHINQEIVKDLKVKFDEFKRVEIVDARHKRKMSLSELGQFIGSLKKENETILTVLNTKKAAEAVYKEVKLELEDSNDILFYFLSTNLCPAHRKEIIGEMKGALSEHKQVVCVSTQLIEAGVDISFSCVVRHVAGLDSIAQASGRGNRNGEGTIKNTYIIQLEDERLGSLKEIELGEQCSSFVLDEYKRDKGRFDNNLLSPKAIKRYYEYFFNEQDIEKKMDYPIPEKMSSIFDMLSCPNKKTAYKNTNNKKYPMELEFQFKTAGRYFEVIDEFSTAVLVPYGEGKNIISELRSQRSALPDASLLKSAQPYMVNVSENVYRALKDNQAIYMEERSGVLILKDNFYDEELGVIPEGKKMGLLMLGQ